MEAFTREFLHLPIGIAVAEEGANLRRAALLDGLISRHNLIGRVEAKHVIDIFLVVEKAQMVALEGLQRGLDNQIRIWGVNMQGAFLRLEQFPVDRDDHFLSRLRFNHSQIGRKVILRKVENNFGPFGEPRRVYYPRTVDGDRKTAGEIRGVNHAPLCRQNLKNKQKNYKS